MQDIEDLKKVSKEGNEYLKEILNSFPDYFDGDEWEALDTKRFESGKWMVKVDPHEYGSYLSLGYFYDKGREIGPLYEKKYKVNFKMNSKDINDLSTTGYIVKTPRKHNNLRYYERYDDVDWRSLLSEIRTVDSEFISSSKRNPVLFVSRNGESVNKLFR